MHARCPASPAAGIDAVLRCARPPVCPPLPPPTAQSRLPSFTDQFTQSVPLTRIRDIAHRCVGEWGGGE